jgi:type II secretory pathway pseudopilin PulG
VKKLGNHGVLLIEIIFAVTIFSIVILIFVQTFMGLNKNIVKSQQYNDLQRLTSASLSEIASQLRQAISVRTNLANDIPVGQNFIFHPTAGNQVVIFVPKLSNPGDKGIADRITYTVQTYNGLPNRLMQQLTTFTRDASNNIVVDTVYPAKSILINMESYRSSPTGEHESTLSYLYNDGHYKFEAVSMYWDYDPDPAHPRGVMAIGITTRAKSGLFQSTYSASTVITARTISGVPR